MFLHVFQWVCDPGKITGKMLIQISYFLTLRVDFIEATLHLHTCKWGQLLIYNGNIIKVNTSSLGRWASPGPGRSASNWPVGRASSSNHVDQPLIVKFPSRFSCSA